MELKKRLRNYGLWVAVASFALLMAQALGYVVAEEQYWTLVNAGLGVLILLGIVNNPTTKDKGFADDK